MQHGKCSQTPSQKKMTMETDELEELKEQEHQEAERWYSHFFGDATEGEQLRLRELASKLNIRDNDALWTIIYTLNYFGRFYQDLPEQIRGASADCLENVRKAAEEVGTNEAQKAQVLFAETLKRSTEEILEQHKHRSFLIELFIPLSLMCFGVFVLCLIAFVAGAATAGKGWGTSPIAALLNAPAGGVLALEMIPVAGFMLYRSLTMYSAKKKATYLITSILLIAFVVSVLTFIF